MSVAKVIELVAESEKSFDDAIKQGLAIASETIDSAAENPIRTRTVNSRPR